MHVNKRVGADWELSASGVIYDRSVKLNGCFFILTKKRYEILFLVEYRVHHVDSTQ